MRRMQNYLNYSGVEKSINLKKFLNALTPLISGEFPKKIEKQDFDIPDDSLYSEVDQLKIDENDKKKLKDLILFGKDLSQSFSKINESLKEPVSSQLPSYIVLHEKNVMYIVEKESFRSLENNPSNNICKKIEEIQLTLKTMDLDTLSPTLVNALGGCILPKTCTNGRSVILININDDSNNEEGSSKNSKKDSESEESFFSKYKDSFLKTLILLPFSQVAQKVVPNPLNDWESTKGKAKILLERLDLLKIEAKVSGQFNKEEMVTLKRLLLLMERRIKYNLVFMENDENKKTFYLQVFNPHNSFDDYNKDLNQLSNEISFLRQKIEGSVDCEFFQNLGMDASISTSSFISKKLLFLEDCVTSKKKIMKEWYDKTSIEWPESNKNSDDSELLSGQNSLDIV